MSNKLYEKNFNNPYYLLDFDQDDLDASSEDEATLEELGSFEQQQGTDEDQVSEQTLKSSDSRSLQWLDKSQTNTNNSSLLYATTIIQREKQTVYNVPEVRSSVDGLLLFSDILTSFTCDIVCGQNVSYKLLSKIDYNLHDLEKLDIVLNENSVLTVQINCTLNGLDMLEYPLWITEALNEVMGKVKFTNITPPSLSQQEEQQQNSYRCYQFEVQKAFVTTPISYLLEKQAPHGVLEKINLCLDWCTNKGSKEFQLVWKRGFQREAITRYAEEALFEVLIRRVFHHYPLIFSNFYVKKLAPIISYFPHISQSLHKIIRTAQNTTPNSEFVHTLTHKIKIIEKNTLIMRPHYSETDGSVDKQTSSSDKSFTTTCLTLGMYYTVSNGTKQQQKKNAALSKLTALGIQNPPDALEAIGKIWSITCSSASPT